MGKKAKQWKSTDLPTIGKEVADDTQGDWWDRVFKLKDERAGAKLQALAEEYSEVKEELAVIDARRTELTALTEALDRCILEIIDATGVEKVTIAGQTFSERVDIEATVHDRKAYLEWIASQYPEYITVNGGHTKTVVKQALDPDEVANVPIAERNNIEQGLPGSNKLPPGVSAAIRRTLGRVETKR